MLTGAAALRPPRRQFQCSEVYGSPTPIGVGVFCVLQIRVDYAWADGYIPIAVQRGFELVRVERTAALDITKPWTLFRPPPSAIYFIREQFANSGRRHQLFERGVTYVLELSLTPDKG
jgi:hypothetical protein